MRLSVADPGAPWRGVANYVNQSDCAAGPAGPAAQSCLTGRLPSRTDRSWPGGLGQGTCGSGAVALGSEGRGDLKDVVGELALGGQQLLGEVVRAIDQRLRLRQLIGVGQVQLRKGRGDGLNGRGPRLQGVHHGVLGRADQLQDLVLGGADVDHCSSSSGGSSAYYSTHWA